MDNTGYHEWHKTQQSKVMFIDSKDANIHSDTTHFTYVFNDSINIKKNEGVLVSLLQASIPYSFYNVREGINDKIDILYGHGGETLKSQLVETIITLPPGNYTAITLATKFKKLLEDELEKTITHNNSPYTLPSTITINYDRDTQKFDFKIEAKSGGTYNNRIVMFNLSHGQNAAQHFDVEIGFDSDTASTSVFFGHNQTEPNATEFFHGRVDLSVSPLQLTSVDNNIGPLVSDNIADLNGSIHSLYLRSNLPVISSMDSLTGGVSSIIAKIPIMSGPGSIIFHEPQNAIHKSLIQSQNIKFITLRLTDDRNRLVSLNGLHFSVAIMFEFVSLKSHHPRSYFSTPPPNVKQKNKKNKKNKNKNVNQLYNKDAEIQTPSILRDTIRQTARQVDGTTLSEGDRLGQDN